MSLGENKAIVREVIEAENNRDLTVIEKVISPSYINQSNQMKGPEGYKQFLNKLFKAFPSWHETIDDMVAEGDKVCVRLTIDTGAHTGEFDLLGIRVPPTGKKSTVKSIQIWRIVDGKVLEAEGIYDELDLLIQVGLIEPKGEGKKLFPENIE